MIRKILKYSQKLIVDILNKKEEVNRLDFFRKLMTNPTFYNVIKVDIEDITLSINDIEDIELKSSDDDSNDDIGELLEGLSEKGEEKITDSL
jgi:disulfide oxidoreductase YuzD